MRAGKRLALARAAAEALAQGRSFTIVAPTEESATTFLQLTMAQFTKRIESKSQRKLESLARTQHPGVTVFQTDKGYFLTGPVGRKTLQGHFLGENMEAAKHTLRKGL